VHGTRSTPHFPPLYQMEDGRRQEKEKKVKGKEAKERGIRPWITLWTFAQTLSVLGGSYTLIDFQMSERHQFSYATPTNHK